MRLFLLVVTETILGFIFYYSIIRADEGNRSKQWIITGIFTRSGIES